MYVQHSVLKSVDPNGNMRLTAVEEGPAVQLLSQTGDHKVNFIGPGDDAEVQTLPSPVFFATHREAFPAEIAAFEKAQEAPRHRGKEKEPA